MEFPFPKISGVKSVYFYWSEAEFVWETIKQIINLEEFCVQAYITSHMHCKARVHLNSVLTNI